MPSNSQDHHVIDVTPEASDEGLSPAERPHKGSGLARALLVITLILLTAVGAALYYAHDYWQDARQELVDVQDRLTTARSAQDELLRAIDDTRRLLDAQQGALDRQEQALQRQSTALTTQENEIQARQKTLETERRSLQEARKALVERLEETSQRIEGDPDRWLIAETASLLRTAGHRLSVMHDRESALLALTQADELLARAGEAWHPAREVLGEEIAKVEAYQPPDVRDIADQLLTLDRLGRELPIKAAIIPPPPAAAAPQADSPAPEPAIVPDGWAGAMQKGLTSLRGLVTVHRTEPGAVPTVAAPYRAYLHQHVRLALDSARLGALTRDAVLYRSSLAAAHDLLNDFFAEGPARDEVIAALTRLADTPLEMPPPQIGRTLSLLESLPRQRMSR